MKVWPFLYSRGHVLDNQLIVCPAVLRNGRWGEFSRILARLTSDVNDETKVKDIENTKVGKVTVIYRSGYAVKDGAMRSDVAGRSVRMIFGAMIEGTSANAVSSLADGVITAVKPSLDAAFEAFWSQSEETGPRFADALDLHGGHATSERRRRDDSAVARGFQRVTTVAAVAALLASVFLGVVFHRRHGETAERLEMLEASLKSQAELASKLSGEIEALKKAVPPR